LAAGFAPSPEPERVFVAKRDNGGAWRTITYARMLARAQAVGQALATRSLSPERPIAILSDNDLEHLTLALGAMWAGVPEILSSPRTSRNASSIERRSTSGAVSSKIAATARLASR